jgi:hypothetical protein
MSEQEVQFSSVSKEIEDLAATKSTIVLPSRLASGNQGYGRDQDSMRVPFFRIKQSLLHVIGSAMAARVVMGGSMNYLYHMKKVFNMLLNCRDQNKDVKNFERHWRRLSLKKQSKKMQFLITTTVGR